MKSFWNYVFGGGGSVFTCDQFNLFFFTGGCATPENRLQPVWNAIPSVKNWDFIGMASGVNSLKGLVGPPTINARNIVNSAKACRRRSCGCGSQQSYQPQCFQTRRYLCSQAECLFNQNKEARDSRDCVRAMELGICRFDS